MVEVARAEVVGVEAVGDLHAALGVDPEQALGALDRRVSVSTISRCADCAQPRMRSAQAGP